MNDLVQFSFMHKVIQCILCGVCSLAVFVDFLRTLKFLPKTLLVYWRFLNYPVFICFCTLKQTGDQFSCLTL